METTLIVRHAFDDVASVVCVPNAVLTPEDERVLQRVHGRSFPNPDVDYKQNYSRQMRKTPGFKQEVSDMRYLMDKEEAAWAKYACHCTFWRQTVVKIGKHAFPLAADRNVARSDVTCMRTMRKVARKITTGRYVVTRCVDYTHDI